VKKKKEGETPAIVTGKRLTPLAKERYTCQTISIEETHRVKDVGTGVLEKIKRSPRGPLVVNQTKKGKRHF